MADNVIQNIGIKATADTGDTVKKLNELSNGLKKVYESAKGIDTKGMSFGQLRQGLQQAQASLRSAEKDIVKYGNTMGQMWRSAKVEEADAKGRIDAFSSALKSLEKQASGMKISIWNEGTPTSNEKYPFGKEEEYTPTQYKFAPIDPSLVGGQGLDQTNAKAEETIGKFSRLRAKIGEAFSQENLQNFSDKMSRISAKAGSISDKMGRVARTVGSAGKRFLSAINPMTMFRNEQNKLSLSSTLLGKAFSRLGRMFRIMVTRMLIRGFISNIREGFQNIAKYSDVVNQKFSAIISSAKTLYNAFASAFTPLIEAIAPYVVKALDFITSAMNKVAEFLSALTGKSYFIKATKYQTNYAKSLDKTGKSAGKTAKKVKELKSATIGIDKLNVIEKNQPDTSNSGAGTGAGGGGGASPSDMFDTKPVSKKMKKLANEVKKIAKKLFDPIQKAWNSKGTKVLGSMKKMLGSIWETIKDIGRDFLTMWQQPATVKIFEDILDTVATIFDIVTAISDQFRKAWNKDNVGLHIFENLRDVVGIVVRRIKKCAEYTRDWAKHLNFSPMLQSIERYTKSLKKLVKGLSDIAGDFYETVVLGISKWVVEKGLPNLIQVFTDFNNKVDWQSLRKSLKVVWEGVEKFGEAVGQGLIDFIHWLADGIADLLNSRWFKGFLESIGKLLKKIKPQQVTSALKLFLKVWLGFKAIKFVSGTLMKTANGIIRVSIAIKKLKTAKELLFGTKEGLKAVASTSKTTKSSLSGLTSALGKVATAIGIFVAVTKAYEVNIGDNGKKIHQSTKNTVNSIEKLSTKANELKESFADTTDSIKSSEIAPYEKVKLYYEELKKITDENGKIKKGYKKQAEYYIQEINKQLGTSVSISGDYVKNLGSATKQLKRQQKLVTARVGNKVLEENGENYYKAKAGSKDAVNKWIEAQKKWQYAIAHPEEYSEKETEELATARNKAYKDYVKFKTVEIRYENLLKAVASGNRKEIEKAIADMNKPIKTDLRPTFDKKVAVKTWKNYLKDTIGKVGLRFNNLQVAKDLPKALKKALTKGIEKGKIDPEKAISFTKSLAKAKYYGVKINENLAKKIQSGEIDMDTAIKYVNALSNAKAKGKDISKYVGDGIFKNKKSVTTAINGLKGEVNKLPKEKKTKVNVDGKKKYKEDIDDANKKAKTVTTKRSTVLDITINFIGKIAKSLKDAFSTIGDKIKKLFGYGNKKQRAGGGGGGGSFAKGGYPKLGSAFIAGEAGAEFVGTINGKTGVTSNQEITGIREAVVDKGNEQNALLQQQNRLLLQILEKNTDVNIDGVKLTKKINKINDRRGYKMATT